jgi:hypothetical protein
MKKLQSWGLKILAVQILLISSCFHTTFAQVSSFRLKTADSLYNAKLYTQSFEHYSEILKQKKYSPAMLLKMAYIQEGLNNVGQAMYFLNLYFLVTNDKEVLTKMEELADRFNLEGYEATETEHLATYYHDHYDSITLVVAAIIVLFLSMVFYTRVRLNRRPVVTTFFLVVLLIGFVVHINLGSRVSRGILTTNRVYIMDGPSAGANLVTIASGGHRVEVIGKKDVWLKIKWNNDIAFIRRNALLPIEL